ncbi:hypothetical protein [Bifidobacterium animalis]|uniref:hypothetical protein n=1 Tax=Bifidobacterium animalis TaxID=28025 RepID=UPI001C3EC489|nr:hypothetical protein [Bifidobacterium animalis]
MIDLSPLYTEATALRWWCWLPILIVAIFSLTCSTIRIVTRSAKRTTPWACCLESAYWLIAFLLAFAPLFCGPRMGDAASRVEEATGVTGLQCDARDLNELDRQSTICTFRYENTFYQGVLTVNDNHQATLYRIAQGTPIPVTRR